MEVSSCKRTVSSEEEFCGMDPEFAYGGKKEGGCCFDGRMDVRDDFG